MPKIYMCPSTDETKLYASGGSEKYFMNLIMETMSPYLNASGIDFKRSKPSMTKEQAVEEANNGDFDLYLALHTDAAPPGYEGVLEGPEIAFFPTSTKGKRAATIFANGLSLIYPKPDFLTMLPTRENAEITKSKAPAVCVSAAYHDNVNDALWLTSNIDNIARNLVSSICSFFLLRFLIPEPAAPGRVKAESGLHVRVSPNIEAPSIAVLPNGTEVAVIKGIPGWYFIEANGITGYASTDYIELDGNNR